MIDRGDALDKVERLLAVATELSRCGHSDIEARAEEIAAIAGWMLYDGPWHGPK